MASPGRAPERRSAWQRNGAADHDVAHEMRAAREIAADQSHTLAPGQAKEAAIEGIDPLCISPPSQRQRDEGETGFAAHGRNVTEAARQRLAAEIFGAVGGGLEMHAFDQHVGGEEQVFGGAARAADGAIVADAEHQAAAAGRPSEAANALDDFHFQHVHFGYHRIATLDHTSAI